MNMLKKSMSSSQAMSFNEETPARHSSSDSKLNINYHKCIIQMPSSVKQTQTVPLDIKESGSFTEFKFKLKNNIESSSSRTPGDEKYHLYLMEILKFKASQWDEWAKQKKDAIVRVPGHRIVATWGCKNVVTVLPTVSDAISSESDDDCKINIDRRTRSLCTVYEKPILSARANDKTNIINTEKDCATSINSYKTDALSKILIESDKILVLVTNKAHASQNTVIYKDASIEVLTSSPNLSKLKEILTLNKMIQTSFPSLTNMTVLSVNKLKQEPNFGKFEVTSNLNPSKDKGTSISTQSKVKVASKSTLSNNKDTSNMTQSKDEGGSILTKSEDDAASTLTASKDEPASVISSSKIKVESYLSLGKSEVPSITELRIKNTPTLKTLKTYNDEITSQGSIVKAPLINAPEYDRRTTQRNAFFKFSIVPLHKISYGKQSDEKEEVTYGKQSDEKEEVEYVKQSEEKEEVEYVKQSEEKEEDESVSDAVESRQVFKIIADKDWEELLQNDSSHDIRRQRSVKFEDEGMSQNVIKLSEEDIMEKKLNISRSDSATSVLNLRVSQPHSYSKRRLKRLFRKSKYKISALLTKVQSYQSGVYSTPVQQRSGMGTGAAVGLGVGALAAGGLAGYALGGGFSSNDDPIEHDAVTVVEDFGGDDWAE